MHLLTSQTLHIGLKCTIEWGLHLLVVRNVSLAQSALKLAGILVFQPVFVVLRCLAMHLEYKRMRYAISPSNSLASSKASHKSSLT